MTVEQLRQQLAGLPAGTTFTRDGVLELLATVGDGATPDAGDLLPASEAARRLGVSKDWLYRRTRELPFARKLSRKVVRYSAAGLSAYLEKRDRPA